MTEQEKEDYKVAAEKLLNSLGRKMGIDYYGYDGNYTVEEVVYDSDDEFVDVTVTTDKPVPETLDVKIEPNFVYGKYATASDLIHNLNYPMRYLGKNDVNVMIQDTDDYSNSDIRTVRGRLEGPEFIQHPENFIELCNGFVVEKSSGYAFPLFTNNNIDVTDFYHIANIDEEEWWEKLCDEDKIELNKTYS